MTARLIPVLFALLFSFSASAKEWLDQSHEVFLPPDAHDKVAAYKDFPVFWWNFLVVEFDKGEIPWASLQAECEKLVQAHPDEIKKSPCSRSLGAFRDFLHDWIRDATIRNPAPSPAGIAKTMDRALVKASFPLPKEILSLLRQDPLGAIDEYLGKLRRTQLLGMEEHQGFFYDPQTSRVAIPLQMSFPPTEASKLASFLESLPSIRNNIPESKSVHLAGPHASALENEFRVKNDVHVVSVVSALLLVGLGLFLHFTRRLRVLLLVPPLLVAIALASGLTILIFGSIHGIVLAFGPGIIGLAMDYGLHSCFMGPDSRRTWVANLLGLVTTCVVLLVMIFSQIPLVRQLMFFSIAGLCLGYAFFYVIMNRFPETFRSRPYSLAPTKAYWPGLVSVLLVVGSLAFFGLRISFSLQEMNFESKRTSELHRWLFGSGKAPTPLLMIRDEKEALEEGAKEKAWADDRKIAYQGPAAELPLAPRQRANLESWRGLLCSKNWKPTPAQSTFFEPFFKDVTCENLSIRSLLAPPAYVRDFKSGPLWVSFFLPTTDAETAAVKAQYPAAASAKDLFSSIPETLYRELIWMLPISLLAAWLILVAYYRDFKRSALAVIPFFTGLGAFVLTSWIGGLPVTFVSIVGLIMVFGMSLDYGVFVVNFIGLKDQNSVGVWSALTLCGYVTVAGFLPLLFAQHPVMFQLGHALTWGSVGTYLGSVFGLPWLYRVWGRKQA